MGRQLKVLILKLLFGFGYLTLKVSYLSFSAAELLF